MCGRAAETLPHVLLGFSAPAQSKYLNRHNAALKMLFFEKIEVDRRVSVLTDLEGPGSNSLEANFS